MPAYVLIAVACYVVALLFGWALCRAAAKPAPAADVEARQPC